MKKYLVLLFLVLIVSCGEANHTTYDYTNETSTLFLNATPSELVFTSKDKNVDLKDFKISYNTNDLTLIDMVKDDKSSDNFNVTIKLNDCVEEMTSQGVCSIKVGIKDSVKDGDSGTIVLKFLYNNDNKAEPQSIKTHKLVYRYQNTAPKP